MARDAIEVANHFIHRSGNTKTNLQILKMTYFAHGYMLGWFGKPLVCDRIEAWDWGVVIPSLYERFKRYGSDIILAKTAPPAIAFTAQEMEILDAVWNHFGRYDGYHMVTIAFKDTRGVQTPWAVCHVKGEKRPIPDHVTKEYYAQLSKRD